MAKSALESYRDYWLTEVSQSRRLMLGVGVTCLTLGAFALAMPQAFLKSVIWIIGAILIVSGLVKASQLFATDRSAGSRRRGWPVIIALAVLDFVAGMVLINQRSISSEWLARLLALLFLAESGILFVMGVRAATLRGRLFVWLTAALTAALAMLALTCVRRDPASWVGLLVGLKLITFGLALVAITFTAPKGEVTSIYDEGELVPIVGELYAVYFGAAFHLGVFVGDDHVVHYLDDNNVWHVTWQKFLEGRCPHHWSYPDLPPVAPDAVVATAMSEVGKTYTYSFLKFNCENFAIFCKSGGATKYSKFAQVPESLNTVALHPVIGMIVEFNTRVVEWLAFHLGGPSGKGLSLAIRKLGAIVTTWLVARQSRQPSKA